MEFSDYHSLESMIFYINTVKCLGYIPIIAHVDRYTIFKTNSISVIKSLKEKDVLFQVNAESILGGNGFQTKRFTHKLLKEDLIDFIASDSHGIDFRAPNLGNCLEYLQKKITKQQLENIFYENPSMLK